MGDPKRLLASQGDDNELGRVLLASVRNVSPPPDAKGQAWEGIAVQVAAVAAIGAAGATAQAAASVSAEGVARAAAGVTAVGTGLKAPAAALFGAGGKMFTAKTVVVAMLAGSTVAAGGLWASHRASERRNVAHSVSLRAAEPPGPTLPASPSRPTAVMAPCDPAFPTMPCAPVASSEGADDSRRSADDRRPRNLLGLESAMLTDARAQLRRGEPQAALATLERLHTRFPKGVLMQEREVLTIQVLSTLGDNAAANRRARAFLDTYPTSPHAPQLRRFIGDR